MDKRIYIIGGSYNLVMHVAAVAMICTYLLLGCGCGNNSVNDGVPKITIVSSRETSSFAIGEPILLTSDMAMDPESIFVVKSTADSTGSAADDDSEEDVCGVLEHESIELKCNAQEQCELKMLSPVPNSSYFICYEFTSHIVSLGWFSLGNWELVLANAPFSPRDTTEGIIYNGKILLSNGWYNGGLPTRDLWQSGDGVTWELLLASTPYEEYSHLVEYQDRLWAIRRSIWTSDDAVHWIQESGWTPFVDCGNDLMEVIVWEGRIMAFGCGDEVWSTEDGLSWNLETDAAQYGDISRAVIIPFHDSIYLLSGVTIGEENPDALLYPTFIPHNDVWSSVDGVNWQRIAFDTLWEPRLWSCVAAYRDKLWLIGGFNNVYGHNLDDVWTSTNGVDWESYPSGPHFSARHYPTCFFYDDSLWVVAGNAWPLVNDVWRLSIDAAD